MRYITESTASTWISPKIHHECAANDICPRAEEELIDYLVDMIIEDEPDPMPRFLR